MKKFLAIILGALFVFSFAASAFAIHSEIPSDTQAVIAKGATQITLGGELRTRGWYKDNINSSFQPVDTNSQAYYDQRVRLSVNAQVTPNVQGFVQLESGTGSSDTYTWGNFNSKPTTLSVLEAWILYKGSGLFGFPVGGKIGHMPLALGEKQFFDHTKFGDDAIVFFMDPTKQMHIGLLTIKFAEGVNAVNTDDLDGYVALMTFKPDDKNTFGVNYTYLNQSNADFSHQNIEVHGNGNVAGFGYKFSADYQFGEFRSVSNPDENDEFNGYAAMLGLSFKLDPVTIRGSVAYGSGDDGDDSDVDNFVTYLGADQHYALVYDYSVATAAGARFTGINNTFYANIGADFAPTKDLKISADAFYFKANEAAEGQSKDLGWEIDANVGYNVARNLSYGVSVGYFDADDFYGDDAKGAAVVRQTLTLSF